MSAWYISYLALCLYQVKVAVAALGNTDGLKWPSLSEQQRAEAGELDALDWLRAMFGFQACIINLNKEVNRQDSLYDYWNVSNDLG